METVCKIENSHSGNIVSGNGVGCVANQKASLSHSTVGREGGGGGRENT